MVCLTVEEAAPVLGHVAARNSETRAAVPAGPAKDLHLAGFR